MNLKIFQVTIQTNHVIVKTGKVESAKEIELTESVWRVISTVYSAGKLIIQVDILTYGCI